MTDFLTEQKMTAMTCCKCGILFTMPTKLNTELRRNHDTFYCPSGHPQYFSVKSDIELAREEAERYKRCAERKLEKLKTQEYRIRHWKGEVTKLKKKVTP